MACGPATQLCKVAELNPDISFTGIDYSETMLLNAEAFAKEKKLNNVTFQKGDISELSQLSDNSYDGIISTMALHHLPTKKKLNDCFKEIERILMPDGRLYIVDFGRLKYLKSVLYFAYMNRKHQPHIFSLDYERSLRAAFLRHDFLKLKSKFLPNYQILSTFLVPLLVIIKSQDNLLSLDKINLLKKEREALPKKYRNILDDIRIFLKLSGLKNDPFK